MTVYLLGAINRKDIENYNRYEAEGSVSHIKYGIECGMEGLAICDTPEVIEGTLPGQRIVLLSFKDRASLDKWLQIAGVQKSIPLRLAASETKFLIAFEGGLPAMPHVNGGTNQASGAE